MAGTIYTASTVSELTSALQAASAGDTIQLAAGNYGNLALYQQNFTSQVTITSADPANPAVFNTIKLNSCSNLTFDNVTVDFQPTMTTVEWDAGVRIDSSNDITFANSTLVGGDSIGGIDPNSPAGSQGDLGIQGYPIGYAFHSNWSQNITIDNCDISEFNKGVMLNNVDGLTVTDSEFHDLRTIGISGGDVSDVTIVDNHFTDFQPWKFGTLGDHGDVIHFWTTASQSGTNDNYYISGNFLEQGSGYPLMGIYLDDDLHGIGYTNVVIEDNVLHLGHLHGIAIEHGDGVIIDDNTLVQSSGTATWAPKIYLTDGTQNVQITDNILTEIGIAGPSYSDPTGNNIVQTNNLFAQVHDPSQPNYIGDLLVNGMVSDGDVTDFAPIIGSAADGLGPSYLTSGVSSGSTSSSGTTATTNTTSSTTTTTTASQADSSGTTDSGSGSGTSDTGTSDGGSDSGTSGGTDTGTSDDGSGPATTATTTQNDGSGATVTDTSSDGTDTGGDDGGQSSGKSGASIAAQSKGNASDDDGDSGFLGGFINAIMDVLRGLFSGLLGKSDEGTAVQDNTDTTPAARNDSDTDLVSDTDLDNVIPLVAPPDDLAVQQLVDAEDEDSQEFDLAM